MAVFTNVVSSKFLIKLICAIQGPVGSTGPKGARGAAGPPVSMTFIISYSWMMCQYLAQLQMTECYASKDTWKLHITIRLINF